MSVRGKCREVGHRFADASGMMALPYVYCSRWFCDGTAVAAWAPPGIAVDLHNAIPLEDRFPPVDLNPDGSVVGSHAPCCTACSGTGGSQGGPCWDCRGTGHNHPIDEPELPR